MSERLSPRRRARRCRCGAVRPRARSRASARYVRSRASAKVVPSPTTLSTRPPVATSRSPSAAVAAWARWTPSTDAAASSPRSAARDRSVGIALAREHDGHGDRLGEGRARVVLQRAGCRGQQQLATAGRRSRGSTTCVSGSPKRALNSMTLTPCAVRMRPGVEQSDERRALGIQLPDDRLGDLARDVVDERVLVAEEVGQPGQRRVRAHAAGVGAGVAVAEALVVLRGAERQHVVAVAQEEQRHLGAGEELLDQHRAGGQEGCRVRERRGAVVGDDDALARGEPVGLHDVRRAEVIERGLDLAESRRARERAAAGHARGIHDPLRERLRSLELRGCPARAEDRDAALAQRVGDARDQRRLGADDDEIDRRPRWRSRSRRRECSCRGRRSSRRERCRRCRGRRTPRARHPPSGARG